MPLKLQTSSSFLGVAGFLRRERKASFMAIYRNAKLYFFLTANAKLYGAVTVFVKGIYTSC